MKSCRLYLTSVRSQSPLIRSKPSPSMHELAHEVERILGLQDQGGNRHQRIIRCQNALAERGWLGQAKAVTPPSDKLLYDVSSNSSPTKENGQHSRKGKQKRAVWVNSKAFLQSYEWRKLRYSVVVRCKGRCEACGAGKEKDIVLHVDHIKPRRLFPELALDPNNLQGLCGPCNHGKGNWDETDWRELTQHLAKADKTLDEAFLDAMARKD